MAVITNLTNSEVVKEAWEEQFLTELRENLVFYNLGLMSEVAPHEGDLLWWMNIRDITPPTVALTTGVDPSSAALTSIRTSAVLEQWGQFVEISDVSQKVSVANFVETVIERLRRSAEKTYDTKALATVFTAGGTVQYAGTAVARNSLADDAYFDFDTTEVRRAVRTLKGADVAAHPRAMAGADYVGIIGPDAVYDIQGDSHWREIVVNTDKMVDKVARGMVGELYGVSFLQTSRLARSSGNGDVALTNSGSASTDVIQSYILGAEHFGVAQFTNLELIMNSRSPRSALGLYGDYGWKFMTQCKELDSTRMIRIESSTSDETRS